MGFLHKHYWSASEKDPNIQTNINKIILWSSEIISTIQVWIKYHLVILNIQSTKIYLLTSSPSSLVQRGIGVPQYLFRDIAQSRAFWSQLAKRFSFTKSGTLSNEGLTDYIIKLTVWPQVFHLNCLISCCCLMILVNSFCHALTPNLTFPGKT